MTPTPEVSDPIPFTPYLNVPVARGEYPQARIQPTPTELALIAAPIWANAKSPYDDYLQACKDALALWQEARRVLQEAQITPDRARL